MKKLSILLGSLGGAFAGYLFSNSKLREELVNAKSPEKAAKILAKHVQSDGKKVGHEVQEFLKSDEVQKNIKKAKTFVKDQATAAKKQMTSYMKMGADKAKSAAKATAGRAKVSFKQKKV